MTPPTDSPRSLPLLLALLEATSEALFAEFRRELEAAGYDDIRPTHGCVFRFIQGDGMRLTELASLAGMTKQSIGEIVDDLTARGYVERIPDPEDRRAKLIRLTAKGETAQATGIGLLNSIEGNWAERYGSDRIADLRALLEEIAAAEAPEAVPELARRALAEA